MVSAQRGGMMKNKTMFNKKGMKFAHICLILPLIHFAIFYVYLNFQSIMLAFGYPVNGGSWTFTFEYFRQFFVEISLPDTPIYRSLVSTLLFFSASLLKMVLCYLVAYFFFKKVYAHRLFQILFLLPTIVPAVVYISLFKEFINTYGPIWRMLYNLFGYEMPFLTGSADTAKWVILFYTMWIGFGIQLFIYVGAMNRIPSEVLESGKLDGCSWLREMFRLVLPLTWETFVVYFIQAMAGIFMATGPILYFTGMAETLDTWTISFYIFAQTRKNLLNYASAIGIFFSVLTIPIVITTRLILRRFNGEISY